MSVHISADKGSVAKTVLLAGDPLRAKYMADHFLKDAVLVSQTRNAFYYTGLYKNKTVTVGASGMGCPSIGIYSFELYTEYEVDTIIRIGTCGGYTTDLSVYDLVNVETAASESTYALHAWGIDGNTIKYQGHTFDMINQTAAKLTQTDPRFKTRAATVHSSDVFYRKTKGTPPLAVETGCIAVEMEAFALFANAQYLGKNAATLLTVSDIIPTMEMISADQREKSLLPMMELALETAIQL
jgi:purine-nucleoside phosphorylase